VKKHYQVIEVPYGWRVVENNSAGTKFHARLYHTEADAQRRVEALRTTAAHLSAVTDVRKRAQFRCECLGECGRTHPEGRCQWLHGEVLAGMAGAVVLAVLPLDHNPDNLDPANLRAYCQLCRQRHDADARNTDALFEIG
jgi:hypothetical protein